MNTIQLRCIIRSLVSASIHRINLLFWNLMHWIYTHAILLIASIWSNHRRVLCENHLASRNLLKLIVCQAKLIEQKQKSAWNEIKETQWTTCFKRSCALISPKSSSVVQRPSSNSIYTKKQESRVVRENTFKMEVLFGGTLYHPRNKS